MYNFQTVLCQHPGSWKDFRQMREGGSEEEADGEKEGVIMSQDIHFFGCL